MSIPPPQKIMRMIRRMWISKDDCQPPGDSGLPVGGEGDGGHRTGVGRQRVEEVPHPQVPRGPWPRYRQWMLRQVQHCPDPPPPIHHHQNEMYNTRYLNWMLHEIQHGPEPPPNISQVPHLRKHSLCAM